MSIEHEIRDEIDNIEQLKIDVGDINNHLSALEELCRDRNQKAVDEAYNSGLDDAWEAARKIFGYEMDGGIPINEIGKAFGYAEDATFCTADIIRHNAAQEAIEKLKAYEEQKTDEIKVGDEVEHTVSGYTSKAIFLEKINDDKDWYKCLFWTGCGVTILSYPKRQFKRTGRHFDIDKILEEMKE